MTHVSFGGSDETRSHYAQIGFRSSSSACVLRRAASFVADTLPDKKTA
jgi:hypothetical protein